MALRALIAAFGLAASILSVGTTDAQAGSHEEILAFKCEIHINANSTLTVREAITVRANGKEIKRGIYRDFVLTYTTDRQIGFFEDFDEIYWNVTGNDWSFAILKAEAVVIIPPQARVVQQTAYTGRRGEKGKDFISSVDAKGFVHFRTTLDA